MLELDTKYNYIFYIGDPFVAQMYAALSNYESCRVCENGILRGNVLLKKIHKLHWSYKLNRKLNLPMKRIWFTKMTKASFKEDKPICYVFFGGQYCVNDYGLVSYIRKQNPENKIVVYFLDLIRHKHIKDFESLKEKCDLIVTYDAGEAKEYNIAHFNKGVYSKLTETTQPTDFAYDLYFVGYAKDRVDRLTALHSYLTRQGVRCCFKLAGVDDDVELSGEGLIKLNKSLEYRQVVADIQKTRCILELTQKNATGMTMRTCEAICYQRKLLSDRPRDDRMNASQFSFFTEPDTANIDFLKSPLKYDLFENDDSLSPVSLVEFIESYFEEKS